MTKQEHNPNNDKELTVVVKTTQGTWTTTFSKTTKVQEVINAVIEHFGFAKKGTYELRLEADPNNPLQNERPLVSYGVKDGDVLIFTDLGIAV